MAIGVALAVLVALIVVLLANSDFGNEGAATPTADVPNVVGKSFVDAEAQLKGLKFEVVRQDENQPTQVADLVLGQDPEGGRKIAQGGKITLKVSSATIPMPNVVGQNRVQAAETLAQSNLSGNFVEEDSDQPPGTVLRSDPAAGGAVPKVAVGRATVTVIVAREPTVPVPDVAGQDVFAANAALGAAGLQVSATVDTPSDTVPRGRVIGTDPPAGSPVPKGSAVRLLISSGPDLVDVPSMVGRTRAEAEAELNGRLGFGLTIQLVNAGPTNAGKVIRQNPASGQLPRGSTITIVVGT
jgi:serine/threonine-protein kinase